MRIPRQGIIIIILLHCLAITAWSLMGLRLHTLSEYASKIDNPQHTQAITILARYIALTGTEQYWDFFAPAPYKNHLSLVVCDDIRFPGQGLQVECKGNILYRSYDGDVNSVFRQFSGDRSRSYRFAEQLLALNDDSVYGQFLRYWELQSPSSTTDYLYLISENRSVQNRSRQTNRLIWVIER